MKFQRYLAIFNTSLKNAINFRGEMFVWSLLEATPLLATFILWQTIFRTQSEVAGFTVGTMLTYYLVGHITRQIAATHFEEHAVRQIQQGNFSKYLIKPISPKLYFIFNESAWRVMTFFFSVLPILILSSFLIDFSGLVLTPATIFIYLCFLVLGYTFDSIISLIIISFGFIFEQAESMRHLKWMSAWIFSGSMLPFELMPTWLSNLSAFLPFKLKFYSPVQLMIGQASLQASLYQLFHGIVWVLALAVIMTFLWNNSLKKYTAVGS